MAEPTPALPREVAVRSADGTVGTVNRKDLQQAIDAGAEVVGQEVLQKAKAEAQYGGLGGGAKAAGLGFLRGATLGLSDVVATGGNAFGDAKENRAAIEGYREANPLASGAGELAGVVAPTLISGGIATPAGAVSALGTAAERGVGKVLGEGLLGKVAGMGVQGAVEGGLYGAGTAISDAAIANHDLTAEQLFASAGKGAFLGGAIGGGLGLAGAGLRYAGGKAVDALANVGAESGGTLASKAQGMAEEAAFSSAGPMLKDVRKLAKYGMEEKVVGRFMLDELPQVAQKPFAAMSRAEIAEASQAVAKKYGERISTAIDSMDAAAQAAGKAPDARAILTRVREEVLKPLDALPGYEGVTKKVTSYLESWGERTGVLSRDANGVLVDSMGTGTASFKDLKRFREGLDDLIFRGNKALSDEPIVKELRQVRSILEDEIGTQGGALSKEAGAEYTAAKEGYRKAKTVADIAGDRVLREEANRSVSLTDYLTGVGAAASMGPFGAAAAFGNKVLRERGNQMLAGLLDSASRVNALKSLSIGYSEKTGQAVRRMLGSPRTAATATVTRESTRTRATKKSIEELRRLAENPAALTNNIAGHVDADVAPNVAASYAMAATRAITYLAAQAPRGLPVSPATPTVRRDPSPLEMMRFQRKLDVFERPVETVEKEIRKGTLTLDHVDALRVMYPSIYDEMRTQAALQYQEAAEKGKLPPYERRLQLGILFGVPLDGSMEPDFVASQQALYSPEEEQAGAANTAGSGGQVPARLAGKDPVAADQMATTSDKLEEGVRR